MSETLTYPFGTDTYRPESFSLKVEDFVLISTPALGGPIRTYEVPGTRLVATLAYGVQLTAERAEIAGWWAKAGLRRNRVRLYHPALVAPRGTMRGSPLVKTQALQGAATVTVKSGSGTLLRGDIIGLTDGLHVVTDDVTFSGGEAIVAISPQVRATVAVDSAVTWDRPTGTFMCLSAPDVPFRGTGGHPSFSVSLVEAP
jgi:hypothetical protein